MKKIGAILLIFCMVMSIAMVPAYAATSVSLYTSKIGTHYTRLLGAYDHTAGELAPDAIAESGMIDTKGITLDPYGEWVEMDIAGNAAGTWSVTLTFDNNVVSETTAVIDLIVDDNLELRVYPYNTGSQAATNVGNVYFPEGAKGLKVKNVGAATYRIRKIDVASVAAGEDTSANIVFSGTDTTYSDTSGTRTLLTDYFDGVCRAEGGNFTVSCDNSCKNYEDGRGYHRAYTPSTIYTDGSWFRYDVSDLADGTYEVIANVSAREGAGAKLSLDGTETQAVTLDSQGATGTTFGAAYDQSLGKITVSDTSQYLKLIQTGEAVFVVNTLTFVPSTPDEGGEGGEGGDDVIEASTTVSYTSDEAGEVVIDSLSGLTTAYVQVSLVRPDTANIGETIWVALYDGSQLKSVTYDPVTDANEYSTTIPVSDINDCTAPMIKTFIWETGTYAPVIDITSTTIQ